MWYMQFLEQLQKSNTRRLKESVDQPKHFPACRKPAWALQLTNARLQASGVADSVCAEPSAHQQVGCGKLYVYASTEDEQVQ